MKRRSLVLMLLTLSGLLIMWNAQVLALGTTIYEQPGNPLNTVSRSVAGSGFADDFVVPGGAYWIIDGVGISASTNRTPDVVFYRDNAGAPGGLACDPTGESGTGTVSFTRCILDSGRYWMAVILPGNGNLHVAVANATLNQPFQTTSDYGQSWSSNVFSSDLSFRLYGYVPGVILTESDGSTRISEDGSSDSYFLGLSVSPSSPVSISISPDAQCSVNGAPPGTPISVTLSDALPVTITVSAVNDGISEGAHTCIISHSLVVRPYEFSKATAPTLSVSVNDPGAADLIFSPVSVTVNEVIGLTANYSVWLNKAPQAGEIVTLNLAYDNTRLMVSPASLNFSAANWSAPQTVTVTAIDKGFITGQAETLSVSHVVASSITINSDFFGLIRSVLVLNIDAPPPVLACRFDDGRLFAEEGRDCAPPVVVYCESGGFRIMHVDPLTSRGSLLFRVTSAEIEAVGIPRNANTTIRRYQNVIISRLTTGEFQLNTWVYDAHAPNQSKAYILSWEAGCTGVHNLSP